MLACTCRACDLILAGCHMKIAHINSNAPQSRCTCVSFSLACALLLRFSLSRAHPHTRANTHTHTHTHTPSHTHPLVSHSSPTLFLISHMYPASLARSLAPFRSLSLARSSAFFFLISSLAHFQRPLLMTPLAGMATESACATAPKSQRRPARILPCAIPFTLDLILHALQRANSLRESAHRQAVARVW